MTTPAKAVLPEGADALAFFMRTGHSARQWPAWLQYGHVDSNILLGQRFSELLFESSFVLSMSFTLWAFGEPQIHGLSLLRSCGELQDRCWGKWQLQDHFAECQWGSPQTDWSTVHHSQQNLQGWILRGLLSEENGSLRLIKIGFIFIRIIHIVDFVAGIWSARRSGMNFGKEFRPQQLQRWSHLVMFQLSTAVHDDLLLVLRWKSGVSDENVGSHFLQTGAHVHELLILHVISGQIALVCLIGFLYGSKNGFLESLILRLQLGLTPDTTKRLHNQLDTFSALNCQLHRIQAYRLGKSSALTQKAGPRSQQC